MGCLLDNRRQVNDWSDLTHLAFHRAHIAGCPLGSRDAALIGSGAGEAASARCPRIARVNRRAARDKRVSLGRAAIIRQRAEEGIDGIGSSADFVAVGAIGETAATVISSNQVVTL